MIDKNRFFREATLAICSSLHITTALEGVFGHLSRHMPLDELLLGIFDDTIRALRSIAVVADGHCTAPPQPLTAQDGLWEWGLSRREPFIISNTDHDPSIRAIARSIERNDDSDLVLPLRIADECIGFLTLRAQGRDRYTSEHLGLLSSVAEPFAIALSNALAHEMLLKQRDQLIDDNCFLQNEVLSRAGDEIIGSNSGLRHVMDLVHQVAPQKSTVLLYGETGTGKEVIANAIHAASPRRGGPFIKLNCGAIAESLIDDELFGHEKGAFTGAYAVKRGRFERANGGTLFLDEIGELPLLSQVRLLRVLQSRLISRVGGEKAIPVDVRVIIATNRDLKRMVAEGSFREDLWFRLCLFPITIPPLRERRSDIPALVRHFVGQKSRELGISVPSPVVPGAMERLTNYAWPGNVRELENLVERELICCCGGTLRFDGLAFEEKYREEPSPGEPLGEVYPLDLDEAMRVHFRRALKMTNGKIHGAGGAAELLGIHPNTLTARMQKLGMAYGRQKTPAHRHIQDP